MVLHAVVLVLVLQVWCCVVKHGLVMLVVIMILKDTATFQVLFIVSLFCVWNITTVEINSGVYTYLKVKFVKCFCLLPWSWFCSCYFGLDLALALVTLVLVLVFRIWSCLHHWIERINRRAARMVTNDYGLRSSVTAMLTHLAGRL